MSSLQLCAGSRRRFLQSGLAVGAAAAVNPIPFVHGEDKPNEPADKLNIAILGCGRRGAWNLKGVSQEHIFALCDVNQSAIDAAKANHRDAIVTQDWRELVDHPKVDAFVISTADHHHVPASVAAMRAGKHVYCEKPLAHTVREARMMQDEYIKRRGKIATQMGTQIHASKNFRRVVSLIQSGVIGNVKEAHVWCNRSILPIGDAVLKSKPVPEGFNWDIWLGPAADRPHSNGYWHKGNINWNRRWDFGNGVLGDMGSHLIDLVFWALDLKRPTSIVSEGPQPDPVACPAWQQVTWQHAQRGDGPHEGACKVMWYHGGEGMKRRAAYLQPKVGKDTNINKWRNGITFIGDKGIVTADYGRYVLSPAASFKDKPKFELVVPYSIGHYKEWIHAAKTGGESLCNFDYSGALIEHNLLGNVAHRAGKKLEWDAEAFKVTNAPEANALLTKEYRKGWAIGKA